MSYKIEKILEGQMHFNILSELQNEESIQWENQRHERAIQSLNDKEYELEKE